MSSEREQRLEEILSEYFLAGERGEAPDRAAFLAQHPDFADDIARFFADFHHVQGLVVPNNGSATDIKQGADAPTPTYRSTPARPAVPAPSSQFGDYELLEEVARGGMGVVYKARQISLGRVVALKMILVGGLASREDAARFRAEAEAVARLDHPDIVPIFEVGEHENRPFYSMRYVDGPSLAHAMSQGRWPIGTLPGERASARIIVRVARAVHYAHQRGILHRDLKPANILLNDTLAGPDWALRVEPAIADFGLAKRLDVDSNLTQSGAIVGTPNYMAPEQAAGKRDLTVAADVYSLGTILYELLTGRKPFQADAPMATLLKVQHEDPDLPRSIVPGLNADLQTICLKGLRKDPGQRYGSAEALAADLERFLAGESILARPATFAEQATRWIRRRPAVVALLLLIFLTNAVGFTLVTWKWLESEDRKAQADYLRGQADEKARQADAARVRAEKLLYATNVSSALEEWKAHHVDRARELLDRCEPEYRSWEWDYLNRQLQEDSVSIPAKGTMVSVSCVGPSLAIADAECVRVVDLQTGKEQGRLKEPGRAVHFDGKDTVLFVATGGGLKRWQVKENKCHNVAALPRGRSSFSSDGTRLITKNGPRTVEIINTHSGERIAGLTGADSDFKMTALSVDGRMAAVGREDGAIELWDVDDRKRLGILEAHQGHVANLAFDRSGKWLLSNAPIKKETLIWDVKDRKIKSTIGGARHLMTAYSPDGGMVALAAAEPVIALRDPASDRDARSIHTPSLLVWLTFSTDQQTLIAGGDDQRIQVWSLAPKDRTMAAHGDPFRPAWSPDSHAFAGFDREGRVALWNASSLKVERLLPAKGRLTQVEFSADGLLLAAAGNPSTEIWRVADGQEIRSMPGSGRLAFAPSRLARLEGKWHEAMARQFDTATWENVGPAINAPKCHRLQFSFDGQMLALASTRLRLLRASNGEVLHEWDTLAEDFAFNPDATLLAGVNEHGVTIWKTKSGEEWLSLKRPAKSISFSPDGRRFAVGDSKGTVSICDVESGQVLLLLQANSPLGINLVGGLAFSPDGRFLAASTPGEITIWQSRK